MPFFPSLKALHIKSQARRIPALVKAGSRTEGRARQGEASRKAAGWFVQLPMTDVVNYATIEGRLVVSGTMCESVRPKQTRIVWL